ncbi:sodium/chloride-dependent transporter family protein [Skeletonema marinoi]|uniref:Sodium/chloride-dependent transporter family protein n=1 Tax=Skeletonema marinoi TaxID=267567 RepID=A0AAD9DE35_9STRA|nr:sodium/chloride-dependent transporter family protein [Skeletonema marinoi]
MAAVGFAVGFGNVWRFPSLAYEYGGGAFFIPYIWRCSLLASLYFRNAAIWEDSTGSEAYAYFLEEIIGEKTLGADFLPTRMVWANVGYIAVTWFVVWLCLAWGIEATGKVTYFTMGLPAILIFVFLGRAVSLPGASVGINAYIGEWDMSVLVNQPECWSRAVSQIFFSVGVTFGVLTAFGSYCPRDGPAFQNSIIISVCNSLFSFIAGFAVFAGLGYLAYEEGVELDQVAVSGPSLLFGAYPVVLATLPGGIHWVRLLFFTLFLLGIDSAFALTDAVVTVTADSVPGANLSRKQIVSGWCVLGFLTGLLYATDAGFRFLDVFDFYINFLVAASGVWFGIPADGNALLGGFVTLFVFYLTGMAVTLFLLKKTRDSMPEESQRSWKSFYILFTSRTSKTTSRRSRNRLGTCLHLGRTYQARNPSSPHCCICPWCCCNKFRRRERLRPLWWIRCLAIPNFGVLTFCFTAATMLVGAAAPDLYNWTFVPQVESSFVGEDEKFPAEESEEQDVEQVDESNPEKAQAEESEAVKSM